MVILVTAAFALAGLAVSLAQSTRYTAEAAFAVHDVSQDLRLLGVNVAPAATPQQIATISAQEVTQPAVVQAVQRQLGSAHLSVAQLQGAVTARVAAISSLVLVRASWGDPGFAAGLANAFAQQAVDQARRRQLDQIDQGIANLESRVGRNPRTGPAKAAQLRDLQQLKTVRQIVPPAQITKRAEPPAQPASPRPVRNSIIGGIVGLAFGLLAAFVRDSLDRRIRRSKDAQDELGYPVLGRIGSSALGSAGLASNGRAFLTDADIDSFRVLRTNLAFFDTERPHRSVIVTSGLAEEGKTTVAASLASAAAAAGQRTLLVDGDLRRAAIASRLGIQSSPGLAEYLAGMTTEQEILQSHPIELGRNGGAKGQAGSAPPVESTLVCISAGQPPAQPAELLASKRCQDFLAKVAADYDLVVIDSSPLLSSVDPLELIPYVDAVVVCVRLSRSTRDEARAVKGTLDLLPKRPTGLVITGLGEHEEEYGYHGYAQA